MRGNLIYGQISYSTADIEGGQFVGEFEPVSLLSYHQASIMPIPNGEYRVIDGELFQVIDALPARDNEPQRLNPEATS